MKPIRRLAMAAGTVALVASALVAPGAHAAPNADSSVRRNIMQVTGSGAVNLPSAKSLATGEVSPAASPNGAALETLLWDRGAEGYSLFAVLQKGQSKARFALDLPEATTLQPDGQGGLWVVQTRDLQNVGHIAAPWALDANGKALATTYKVRPNGVLEQTVNIKGAAFPVTADPSLQFGTIKGVIPVVYVKYTRTETLRIASAAATIAAIVTPTCGYIPHRTARIACSAIVGSYFLDIRNTARAAKSRAGRCLKIRYPLSPTASYMAIAYDAYHVYC